VLLTTYAYHQDALDLRGPPCGWVRAVWARRSQRRRPEPGRHFRCIHDWLGIERRVCVLVRQLRGEQRWGCIRLERGFGVERRRAGIDVERGHWVQQRRAWIDVERGHWVQQRRVWIHVERWLRVEQRRHRVWQLDLRVGDPGVLRPARRARGRYDVDVHCNRHVPGRRVPFLHGLRELLERRRVLLHVRLGQGSRWFGGWRRRSCCHMPGVVPRRRLSALQLERRLRHG